MSIPGGKIGKALAALAVLVLVIRFRAQIMGVLAKIPVVGGLAGVMPAGK